MPKSRTVTRANKRKEQLLDTKNSFGSNDLTAYLAVRRIVKEEKKTTRYA